ncbi:MAG: hypothetical protein IIZ68_10605, partial [Clostridia bacterium]|nr:hypothetical protein [Clostridia bacterium]
MSEAKNRYTNSFPRDRCRQQAVITGEAVCDHHVVSINTTTGFTISNYELWPTFSKIVLFCFFFIGGCASSTG